MQRIVYTGGSFDLFHGGYVNFLRQCASFGDVIVALNTDEFVERFKGKKPVMTYAEREMVLRACKYVRGVIPNLSGEDSKPTIMSVGPNFIIIGDDWKQKDYYKQMNFTKEWLQEKGIELIYVPYTQNISTSNIKKRIKEME
jgi:glycerol-3-phosphate cytidylyltransferase